MESTTSKEGKAAGPEERPGLSDLAVDAQLCLALSTAGVLVTKIYRQLLAPLDLTHPQYLILIALLEADGPQTIGSVGRKVSLETGSMTPLVKRLTSAGFIEKRRDTEDERKIWIALTQKGRAVRSRLEAVRAEVVRRLPLDARQLRALRDQLQDMNRSLAKRD